jgi:endonuclease G, mitochondrial
MKRFIYSLVVVLLSLFFVNSTPIQDEVVLKHTNYTSKFSISKKYPVMVEWWVTKAMVSCPTPLKRKDNFKPDPLLPQHTDIAKDYVGSGYDRGHMMPAADNLCQTQQIQDESFYFSNMSAQTHRLNAGDWKSLETFTRDESKLKDSIHVWAGNVGEIKKIGSVSVPKYCWKVIHIKKENKWVAYLFENNTSVPDGFKNNEVALKEIMALTGIYISLDYHLHFVKQILVDIV